MLLSVSTDNVGLQLLIFIGLVLFVVAFAAFFIHFLLLGYEYFSNKYSASENQVSGLHIQSTLLRLNYFKNLSPEGKEKFVKRVKQVVSRLEFSTEGGIEADEEKQVLIAAAAVQITFGLKEYDIDSIERIKIFADDIYNPRSKTRYKGLTFLNGNMFLSWKYFLEGIKLQDDGINLGLHETGHGLYILLKQFRGYEDFDGILKEWYKYAYNEIDHNSDGKDEFLRKYADANIQEFFAICIENFFERPAEFQKKLPLIYGKLCSFLNQNPLNPADYEFNPESITSVDPPSERLYLNKNRPHPLQGFLIWVSGMSVLAIILLKPLFMETLFNLLLFSIPCMLISYNLLKKMLLQTKRLSKKGYLLFCFTGVNPIIFVLLMLLNFFVSSGIQKKETYRVIGKAEYFMGINQNDFAFLDGEKSVFMLENNNNVPLDLRVMQDDDNKAQSLEYTYHYGITGMRIFDSVKLKQD
ncbi:MAG TPA: zinc-dependent peptidase [Bacteroidia bacterium]|jgi:Mlc titration factor MtfA (ptsG expression regulator)|nr:zinc-dependent peptidase [Bacteroidia bacterium]